MLPAPPADIFVAFGMVHSRRFAHAVQGVKGGLSGVTAVSGQLRMDRCSVHDCTYGVEVGRDGHAQLRNTDVCFTECALMCEGHMALTHCAIWANVAAWHGRAPDCCRAWAVPDSSPLAPPS